MEQSISSCLTFVWIFIPMINEKFNWGYVVFCALEQQISRYFVRCTGWSSSFVYTSWLRVNKVEIWPVARNILRRIVC